MKFLNLTKKRLADKEINFTYDNNAVKYIHKHSYDPIYGARPIRRYVQSAVETPLAKKILNGEVGKEIFLTSDGNELIFR